jgi:uncharacterized protein YtpQ (UPF0354 family)
MGFFDRFRKSATPQPPSQHEYADLIMAGLRKAGDTRSWTYEADRGRLVEIDIATGTNLGIIQLQNMYREYVNAGSEGRAEAMRRQVAGMTQQYIPPKFADAKAKLRPVIRSTTERGIIKLQGYTKTPENEMAYRPLCENLEIGIAYDGEFNLARLSRSKLAEWGVSFDEALDIATDNLRLESSNSWLAMQNGVFLSQFGDFYDASRLLLTDVLYRQSIAGAPVVMAPNRTVLLLTGDRNEAGLRTMVEIAEQAQEEPRPLPPLMLRWSGSAWEKFTPEPLAATLHRMRLRQLASDYQVQLDALNQIHVREQRDVFVAKHTVVQREDGVQRSFCAWTEGIHSLLPDTDFFALYRPSTKQTAFVPRHEIKRRFASIVKPTEHLPIRYEVNQFPDAETFQELFAKYERLSQTD